MSLAERYNPLDVLPLQGRHVFFVFPVFNESPNMEQVFGDTDTLGGWVTAAGGKAHFLFVDDGSTDGTAPLIEARKGSGVTLLRHARNQGPGRAFQTAFSHLLTGPLGDDDIVVTLEADATSDPGVFRRMMVYVGMGDEVVMASPYLYGGGLTQVTFHRLLLSHIANGLVKLIFRLRGFGTFSCFYRAYTGAALRKLAQVYGTERIIVSRGFECAVEMLIKMARAGLVITEVPLRVDWSRRKGKSKMRVFKTALGYLKLLLIL